MGADAPRTRRSLPFSDEDREIGARIAKARVARGMNQMELGQAVGMTRSTVNNVERGDVRLHAVALKRMARVLDCSADFLVGLQDGHASIETKLDRLADLVERISDHRRKGR